MADAAAQAAAPQGAAAGAAAPNTAASAAIPPNQTLYLRNLNEKIRLPGASPADGAPMGRGRRADGRGCPRPNGGFRDRAR